MYRFFSTSLGLWFLSTVVIGGAVYFYSERNQCVVLRDADYITDMKNQTEFGAMLIPFFGKVSTAKTPDDLKQAWIELGPNRHQYVFLQNKERTALEIVWERGVFANRWGVAPTFNPRGKAAVELVFRLAELLLEEPAPSDVAQYVADVQKLEKSLGPFGLSTLISGTNLWTLQSVKGSCGLWNIITQSFRGFDPNWRLVGGLNLD